MLYQRPSAQLISCCLVITISANPQLLLCVWDDCSSGACGGLLCEDAACVCATWYAPQNSESKQPPARPPAFRKRSRPAGALKLFYSPNNPLHRRSSANSWQSNRGLLKMICRHIEAVLFVRECVLFPPATSRLCAAVRYACVCASAPCVALHLQ